MTPDQYRFSGYQLPLVQLDATGPAYILISKDMMNSTIECEQLQFQKVFYINPDISSNGWLVQLISDNNFYFLYNIDEHWKGR